MQRKKRKSYPSPEEYVTLKIVVDAGKNRQEKANVNDSQNIFST
jgi:hypothetical protein